MTKYYLFEARENESFPTRIIIFLEGREFGKSYLFQTNKVGGSGWTHDEMSYLGIDAISYSGAVKRFGRKTIARARKAVIDYFNSCGAP